MRGKQFHEITPDGSCSGRDDVKSKNGIVSRLDGVSPLRVSSFSRALAVCDGPHGDEPSIAGRELSALSGVRYIKRSDRPQVAVAVGLALCDAEKATGARGVGVSPNIDVGPNVAVTALTADIVASGGKRRPNMQIANAMS